MKETLTREEILERSKRENRNGDERERTVRVQGESFSLIFVFLMGLALIAWKRFHSLPAPCLFGKYKNIRILWKTDSMGCSL